MIRSLAHGSAHFSTFFFFNDTATTEIYTLSLHDALPIFEWVLLQRAYKVPQMHQSYSHLLARHKRAHVVVKAFLKVNLLVHRLLVRGYRSAAATCARADEQTVNQEINFQKS